MAVGSTSIIRLQRRLRLGNDLANYSKKRNDYFTRHSKIKKMDAANGTTVNKHDDSREQPRSCGSCQGEVNGLPMVPEARRGGD